MNYDTILEISDTVISSEFELHPKNQYTVKKYFQRNVIFYRHKKHPDFVVMSYNSNAEDKGLSIDFLYIVIDDDDVAEFALHRSYRADAKDLRPKIDTVLKKICNKTVLCHVTSKSAREYAIHHLRHTFDNRKKSLIILSTGTHAKAHGDEKNAIPPIVRTGNNRTINTVVLLNQLIIEMNSQAYTINAPIIAKEIAMYAQGKLV